MVFKYCNIVYRALSELLLEFFFIFWQVFSPNCLIHLYEFANRFNRGNDFNCLGEKDYYTEEKFNQVKKVLDRFNSGTPADVNWTNKVTDVRNWFSFSAVERYAFDGSEKEFYSDSSGKSGGQKEKLAYTILASALAYQFGPAGNQPKSKSFRFVMIDEAFGRGSDESTRYGLDLFKKLNLQLLIITPLQKIHIIENYINLVLTRLLQIVSFGNFSTYRKA
ncbi:hypothetical protein ES707_21221 [subsurface metagenome]